MAGNNFFFLLFLSQPENREATR